jgi:hypothetical protein
LKIIKFLQSKLGRNKSSFSKIIADLNPQHQKLIYLHHEWGGGADLYLQHKIEELKNSSCIFVIIYKKKLDKINLQVTYKEQFASILLDNFVELEALLGKRKIDVIYINQISFFPNLDSVFDFLKQIKDASTKVSMLMHDFSCICKNAHLVKENGDPCSIISSKNCCDCSVDAVGNFKKWGNFLENQAEEVICFSQNSKQIITQVYPFLSPKIQVIPHHVPLLRKIKIEKTQPTINIATIGFLNKIKGCDIIEEMSKIIINNNLPVKIISIGKCKAKGNHALKILGKYKRNDLPKIIEENEIDIVFISSICPETFSYATHEAMVMGLKVACFDIGAQAEYVKKYDKGLIISKIHAKTALDEILNFVKTTQNNENRNN